MAILPSSSHVSIAVWLHHFDFNETPGEKARLELHKNATCSFQQILEAECYKTAAVQQITSHLTNHLSSLYRCGTRLQKWGTQSELNLLMKVC